MTTALAPLPESPIDGRPFSMRLVRRLRRKVRNLFASQYADAMEILDRAAGRKMPGKIEPDWRSMFTGEKLKAWADDVYPELSDGWKLGAEHGVGDIQDKLDEQDIAVSFGHFDVEAPNARQSIQRAAMDLSHESNGVTRDQLDKLNPRLRAALIDGTANGDGYDWIAGKIQDLFGHADKYRSQRIAVTETQRAIHDGLLQQYKESGVVERKVWLLSGAPCDTCIAIAAENEAGLVLDGTFARIGENANYQDVQSPPAHPNCMCSMICELIPVEQMPRRAA